MRSLHLLPIAALTLIGTACATIGNPGGGPKDLTPPVVTRTNPAPGTLNFNGKRLTITLNKNIQLDDAFNKVVVSPAQIQPPQIRANAKTITVELRDTLLPNTTYTIDFADAIKDLNEGNILDGFATDFSTGDVIDSLRISGMVLEARTLEPAQGIIVGAYTTMADSAFTTMALERITKTNARGQFTLRNLREVPYRLFALNDMNRDYHWDRSEDMAFYAAPVTPSVVTVTVADTLKNAAGADSVAYRKVPRYLPDDLLLSWFNENYRAQYVRDYQRPDSNRVLLKLGARPDSLPHITVVSPERLAGIDLLKSGPLEHSAELDSLVIWMRDPALRSADTLRVEVCLLRPDSTGVNVWMPDTLNFIHKRPKRSKKELQELERSAERELQRRQALADSLGVPLDSIAPEQPPRVALQVNLANPTQELNLPIAITVNEPLDTLVEAAIRMEIKADTVWVEAPAPRFRPAKAGNPMLYEAEYEWLPATTYRLVADSAAMTGIYGHNNDQLTRDFTTPDLTDYGSITFRLSALPDSAQAVVELLDPQEKVVAAAPAAGNTAAFEYLKPGTYYARLFIDSDGDGSWGNGHYSDGDMRQPDDVYYFPKKISLKKNWDIDQPWDIEAVAVDRQKPFEIKKKKAKDELAPPAEKEEETPLPPGLE